MTVIFNFCSLAASIFCLSAGFRLHHSYQRGKTEILRAYSNGFFSVSLAYFLLALPGFIIFNPFWIQIVFISVNISFLVAILFSGPAIFGISKELRHHKRKIFFFILFLILIYIFLDIIFFSPALPLRENNTVYYWKAGTPWLQSIVRAFAVVAALLMAIFFFSWAKVSVEKNVSYRAFLLGLSTSGIAAAGFILWFFPFFYFSSNLLIFSGILGLSSFMIGIIVKEIV